MKRRSSSSISQPADSRQISEPLLRLIRHSDPRDLTDSPSPSLTVERFKKRFLQRLTNNLYIAEAVVRDALVAEGYSEPAARAEVERFSSQVVRAVREFSVESMSRTMVAEELERAQAGLELITPMQEGGNA